MSHKKLSEADICTIRLQLSHLMAGKQLAHEFGVSEATITRIKQQWQRERCKGG